MKEKRKEKAEFGCRAWSNLFNTCWNMMKNLYSCVQLYKTHQQWKLCMLANSFSFHSHPTYTGDQLTLASEKYSL